MSKNKKALIIILGIIFIPFFMYKLYKLDEYYRYPGKVVNLEKVNVTYVTMRGHDYVVKNLPVVEYYTLKDTFSFSEAKQNFFSFYNVGDKVTILEKKNDSYKTTILSFWYYFMSVPELIILMLIAFVLFGSYFAFINKKS